MNEDKKKEESWLNVFRDMDKKSILALVVSTFLIQHFFVMSPTFLVIAILFAFAVSFCVVYYETWRLKNRRAPNPGFLV